MEITCPHCQGTHLQPQNCSVHDEHMIDSGCSSLINLEPFSLGSHAYPEQPNPGEESYLRISIKVKCDSCNGIAEVVAYFDNDGAQLVCNPYRFDTLRNMWVEPDPTSCILVIR